MRCSWVIIAICLLASSPAWSADLEWRGFFTTGTAFSDSGTPYLGGVNKTPRFVEETLLGLNLNKDINEQWRLGAQMVARIGQADAAAKFDWAFVSYTPTESFGLTLGKQRVPLWMISAYYDVGRTYPWVQPPEEVYSIFNVRSFTGVSANYSIKLGDSKLEFRPYTGDIVYEGNPSAPARDTKSRASNMAGGSVEWSKDKFLLRAAYTSMALELNAGAAVPFGVRRADIVSGSLRDEWDGFLVMAEYAVVRDRDDRRYLREAEVLKQQAATAATQQEAAAYAAEGALKSLRIGHALGYYATLGKQLENWLPHITVARIARPFAPNLDLVQKSVDVGLNYDLSADAVVKAEVKRIDLPDNSLGLFDMKPPESGITMVYRLGYSMIF